MFGNTGFIHRGLKRKLPNDIELPFPGFILHITDRDAWGNLGLWEVWLNTEVQLFDGLCIGTGATREAAIEDARKSLVLAEGFLGGVK